jgi:hypothetical protein
MQKVVGSSPIIALSQITCKTADAVVWRGKVEG